MIILFYLFIIGLFFGSFLNVLIDRLPRGKPITGRSHCDHCQKTLSWIDLIPFFSFLFLRGRCRYCKKSLSLFYPLVEFTTALAFAGAGYYFLATDLSQLTNATFPTIAWRFWLNTISLTAILAILIVIFFADIKYHIIPDSMQIALAVFSLIFHQINNMPPAALFGQLTAALATAAPIYLLYLATRGKGIGFGDVKLAANIGFLLGLAPGLIVLYLSFVSGGLIGLLLVIFRKAKLKSPIAFGPFLVGSLLVVFFAKQPLLDWLRFFVIFR